MQGLKTGLIYLGIFITLAFLSGYFAYSFLDYGTSDSVPDLIGKSLDEAKKLARNSGLSLKVIAEENNKRFIEGQIISQDVTAGSMINGIDTVGVIVSKGPMMHLIPSAIGNTLQEATEIFKNKGLEISRVITVHSNSVSKDVVIAQRPVTGEESGESITLIVSDGPYNVIYYCPELEGKTVEQAVNILREIGLNSIVMGTGSIVNSQRPDAGAIVNTGSVVYLKLE